MSEIYLNIFYALFSIFVSVIFWLKDSNKPIIKLLISMHSILLLLILVGAMYIGLKLQIYNRTSAIILVAKYQVSASFELFLENVGPTGITIIPNRILGRSRGGILRFV